MGGVNLVAGFRPELWREAAPDDAPAGVAGFDADLVGSDGLVELLRRQGYHVVQE